MSVRTNVGHFVQGLDEFYVLWSSAIQNWYRCVQWAKMVFMMYMVPWEEETKVVLRGVGLPTWPPRYHRCHDAMFCSRMTSEHVNICGLDKIAASMSLWGQLTISHLLIRIMTYSVQQATSHYLIQWQPSSLRQLNCWSLRCSWSIDCRRCSNYIFILNLTPAFNELGKENCKMRRETFEFRDLVQLILETLRYLMMMTAQKVEQARKGPYLGPRNKF